jgi:hypothetical protein
MCVNSPFSPGPKLSICMVWVKPPVSKGANVAGAVWMVPATSSTCGTVYVSAKAGPAITHAQPQTVNKVVLMALSSPGSPRQNQCLGKRMLRQEELCRRGAVCTLSNPRHKLEQVSGASGQMGRALRSLAEAD